MNRSLIIVFGMIFTAYSASAAETTMKQINPYVTCLSDNAITNRFFGLYGDVELTKKCQDTANIAYTYLIRLCREKKSDSDRCDASAAEQTGEAAGIALNAAAKILLGNGEMPYYNVHQYCSGQFEGCESIQQKAYDEAKLYWKTSTNLVKVRSLQPGLCTENLYQSLLACLRQNILDEYNVEQIRKTTEPHVFQY